MTFDDEKITVVRDFLLKAFHGAQLSIREDAPSGSRVFSANLEGSTYTVKVRDDFLRQHDADAIPRKLESFLLIEHLRDMPGTTFMVTLNGLEL